MNILKKLTKIDLKLNKKRTIGTLIGIILSAALITVVLSMGIILRNTLIKSTIEETGYYHIQLSDIPIEDVELLKVNRDYSHMEVVKDLGHSITEIENGEYYNHIYSMNESTFKYLKYDLIKGNYPVNNNEALISNKFAERYINQELKIGDKITLDVGDLVNEENEIIQSNYYSSEKIINSKKYEFIITGFIEGSPSVIITTGNDSFKNDVYLTLKNPKNYENDFKELLGCTNKTYCNDKYDYYVNLDLLRWEVFSFSEENMTFLYSIIAIIVVVILFTSVFSIRNSFAISTTEKAKMYGMLRSVGATKKQVKKMVFYEGFILGFFGLLIGSLLGIIVTYLLTIVVNKLMIDGNMFNDKMHLYYRFSIIPILISYVIGIIMIYLSSIPSAKKASKVSPIEIMKDDAKNVKLKTPKFVNKIFKIGGTLSYKNLKRSKKKYKVTVISLTISIFVFITVSTFVLYGIKSINEGVHENYDLALYDNNNFNNIDLNKLKSLGEAHFRYYPDNGNYNLYDTTHILNDHLITSLCSSFDENYNCIEKDGVFTSLMIYDDDSFKELSKIINVNYEKIKDKAIILNYKMQEDYETKKKKLVKSSNYSVGDKIKLENNESNKNIIYEIGALTDYKAWGVNDSYFTIIIDKDYYKNNDLYLNSVYFMSKDTNVLEKQLKNISDTLDIYNVQSETKQMKTLILVISIFIYGFIIVVTLIGLTSVFNTITSNMELRQKDFAVLKSIGMTKKEFNNMILLESLFYSFKSLFYGIILGITGSYLVYKVYAEQIDYGYIFPFTPILISIVFIIFVVVMIMKYSINKINKQNIIETIRQNNI